MGPILIETEDPLASERALAYLCNWNVVTALAFALVFSAPHSPSSRTFVSYLGESARIFQGDPGRHVGDEVKSRSVGGVLGLLLRYLGIVGGSCDVAS